MRKKSTKVDDSNQFTKVDTKPMVGSIHKPKQKPRSNKVRVPDVDSATPDVRTVNIITRKSNRNITQKLDTVIEPVIEGKVDTVEANKAEFKTIVEDLSSRLWRLNNLYSIVDQDGHKIKFGMNEVQRNLYDNRWYLNLVPKARQHGITTFVDLMGLDKALFEPHQSVAIIAQTKNDAKRIFEEKVKFPYDNLPDIIKNARKAKTDSANELRFSNGSSIRVDAAGRGGTFSFMHISEMAKICAESPDKAKEIITGALQAVHQGNVIFMESTSQGAEGYFYEYCKAAYDRQLSGVPLTMMDYKLHFYPWWQKTSNRLINHDMVIFPYLENYFAGLEVNEGIHLDAEQKAWYCKKIEELGSDMTRENPSCYMEVFQVSVDGAYYQQQFTRIRQENRICNVPYMDGYLVDTSWDLGVGDDMVIWFTQTVGRELHVINYYENSGEGLPHYIDKLFQFKQQYGYRYGRHIAPHDIMNRELSARFAETRWHIARNLGVQFDVAPNISIEDGIENVRQLLNITWFDEANCVTGYTHLENYKKEWDRKNGMWKNKPAHSRSSHSADAFRMRAVTWKTEMSRETRTPAKIKRVGVSAWS